MKQQPDLFASAPPAPVLRDLPLPYQRNSETSRLAAESSRPRAPTDRATILEYLLAQGERGATNEEISDALGIKLQTVCPRVLELRQADQVVSAGRRATRSGRLAEVWTGQQRPRLSR